MIDTTTKESDKHFKVFQRKVEMKQLLASVEWTLLIALSKMIANVADHFPVNTGVNTVGNVEILASVVFI
jgi:hypothetical protein